MIFYKNKKGSALVFSMIILGIMILTGLSFAAITVTERKNAISTGKSTQAFQSADSAAELALAVLKDYQGSAGTLGEFAGNLGAICSDGADGLPAKIELSDSSLNFFDVNSDPIEECGDAVYKIAKIKSLGTSGDLTRAIEAPIEMCSDEWIAKEENRRWSDLASSADGKILAAVVDNGASDAYTGDDGFIYISTDGGDNWEAKLADVPRRWYDIDMSADGTFLIAVENGGNPWVSEDYGNSWTMRGNPGAAGTRNWYEVAYLNGDGRLLLAEFNGVNGRIWSSDNKGVDWTRRTDTNRKWVDIAASSDGQKLVAITFNDLTATDSGGIFTSIDRGNTWQRRTTDSKKWDDVASSPNGTYLAAVIKDGGIYVSDDSGVNWNPTSAPDRGWEDIISIGEDGQTLMASVNGGSIYTSTDRGVTWEEESAGSRKWFDLVSSADGKQIVAIDEGGKIYIKKICN